MSENVVDVLVVGSGVAGMYGALQFDDNTKVRYKIQGEKNGK